MELSIESIARCIDLPAQKVERWIRQGRIPLVRKGNICAFDQDALQRWASLHGLPFNLDAKDPLVEGSETRCPPSLIDAMARGGVHHDIGGRSAMDVLNASVSRMDHFSSEEKSRLIEKLLEREQLTSTGIGKGIAIPHPRDPLAGQLHEPQIATFFLEKAVDFHSLDHRPVFVLFILICPSIKIHLHLLSRLSFCLRNDDFIAFLNQRPSAEALMERVSTIEPDLDLTSRLR